MRGNEWFSAELHHGGGLARSGGNNPRISRLQQKEKVTGGDRRTRSPLKSSDTRESW